MEIKFEEIKCDVNSDLVYCGRYFVTLRYFELSD